MTVVVVMGVSGSGKSTVAGALAARLGWDLVEGDDLHDAAAVARMAAGRALTDADRAPWLARVRARIDGAGRDLVVSCSALSRAHRDVLRADGVVFAHLVLAPEVIAQRLSTRQGHFMPASLLASQLAALEPPGPDERSVTVDADGPVDEVVGRLIHEL